MKLDGDLNVHVRIAMPWILRHVVHLKTKNKLNNVLTAILIT